MLSTKWSQVLVTPFQVCPASAPEASFKPTESSVIQTVTQEEPQDPNRIVQLPPTPTNSYNQNKRADAGTSRTNYRSQRNPVN